MNLTEATVLALQGRLNLQENLEIETDEIEVTMQDNKTIIDTEDSTITVEKNDEVKTHEESIETAEEVVPTEDIIEDAKAEDDIETIEELDEEKKLDEEKTTGIVYRIKFNVGTQAFEEAGFARQVKNALSKLADEIIEGDVSGTIKDDYGAECLTYDSDEEEIEENFLGASDEVIADSKEKGLYSESKECLEKDEDEEECETFNSETFNKAFENYFKENNKNIQKFKVKNVSKNKKGDLKIESVITENDRITQKIFIAESYKTYGNLTKYKFENIFSNNKTESKQNKLKLFTTTKNKVIECKVITK